MATILQFGWAPSEDVEERVPRDDRSDRSGSESQASTEVVCGLRLWVSLQRGMQPETALRRVFSKVLKRSHRGRLSREARSSPAWPPREESGTRFHAARPHHAHTREAPRSHGATRGLLPEGGRLCPGGGRREAPRLAAAALAQVLLDLLGTALSWFELAVCGSAVAWMDDGRQAA